VSDEVKELTDFIGAIGHPIRRQIIRILHKNMEVSYSDLLSMLNIETGKLNFHLKKLQPLLEQTQSGKYKLSEKGRFAHTVISLLEKRLGGESVQLKVPRASFVKRFIAWFLDIMIIYVASFASLNMQLVDFEPFPWFNFHVALPYILVQILRYTFFLGSQPFSEIDTFLRIYLASILWAYWTITEGYKGQSLGKILMGIRVVKSDGRRLPLQDSAVRSIGKAFLLPLDVIVGLMFFRRKKVLRFTDYYTDTIVVEV